MAKKEIEVGPFWQEIRTTISQKEVGARIVTSLAFDGQGLVCAGSIAGISEFDGTRWIQTWLSEKGCPASVGILAMRFDSQERLWVGTTYGLYVKTDQRWSRYAPDEGVFWKKEPVIAQIPCLKVTALASTNSGTVWAAGESSLVRTDGASVSSFSLPKHAEILSLAADNLGRLCVGTTQGLWTFDDAWHGPITPETTSHGLPGLVVRALAVSPEGAIWAGTSRGLGVLRPGGTWQRIAGEEGLPVENVTSLAFNQEGEAWVGTIQGVCRFDGRRWHYYGEERWIPGPYVSCLAVGPDQSAWVATPQGISKISREKMTLQDKARHYEAITAARHHRMGWISSSHLRRPGDLSSNETVPSDNDGLWTGLYVAAESFRYAVTGEEVARRNAKECFHAMLRLEEMSDIDGFPTKAIIPREQMDREGGIWHVCQRYPSFAWKGDCSSDEIDGHLFAYSIYYDLAADDEEKVLVVGIVRKIMDHILRNNYHLIGLDGRPTRWGVWSPEDLLGEGWAEERGLNSLEILSHLKAAHHITGEARYEREYHRLIEEHGYARNVEAPKIMIPATSINHSDDELAFLSYYPLLRYEKDPELRALYVRSIEASWAFERLEGSPFFNFLYGGAAEAEDPDSATSVQYLMDLPLDLIAWTVKNSHRADIRVDSVTGRFGELQGTRSLPPDEKPMGKWNSNPYALDSNSGGRSEEDGALFLLPYWIGRYHGYIRDEARG